MCLCRIQSLGLSINPIVNVKTSILQASQDWEKLDNELLTTQKQSVSSRSKAKIDVPRSVFLSSMDELREEEVLSDCQFERLPRDHKEEYTQRLAKIFASIPKLKDQEEESKDWGITKYNSSTADLESKPELEIPDVKLEQVKT